jgi:hypothetical protein
VRTEFLIDEEKQDLKKRMVRQMRAWLRPDSRLIVLRNQDQGHRMPSAGMGLGRVGRPGQAG